MQFARMRETHMLDILTAVVAQHTRGVADVPARVEVIRSAAGAWAQFGSVNLT